MKKKNIQGKIYLEAVLFKKLPLTIFAMLATLYSFAAAISSVPGGGAWNVGSTWVGGIVPGTNDDVTIVAGATVTVPAAANCRSLTVNGNLNMTGTSITLTISNNSPLVLGSGSNLFIGSTNTVYFSNTNGGSGITNNGGTIASTGTNGIDGGTIQINVQGGGGFTIGGTAASTVNNLKFNSNSNFNISSSGLLINGTFTIPNNNWNMSGSVQSPSYGPGSTLYINNNNQGMTGTQLNGNLAKAWSNTTGPLGTAGYPNNVTIVNVGTSSGGVTPAGGSNVNVGWRPTGAIGLNGTLSIGDGTTNAVVSLDQVTSFSSGGITVDNNSTLISPGAVTYTDKGNFILQGATTGLYYSFSNSTAINFGGTGTSGSPQVVSTNGASIAFPNMTVSNGTYVQLQKPVTVSGNLNLTSGYVGTTATNLLSVTNTTTTAVTGGSSTAYVDGPLAWSLAAGAGNYAFPIGSGTSDYLPLTLNKAASSATIATVQGFGTGSGGVGDATVGMLSTTEYWSLKTSVALPAGSSVSVARPTAIAPMVLLAESQTAANATDYTKKAGTVGTNGISNSSDIGAGSAFYFTFAELPIVSTLAATSITTTSATLNGAFNTGSSKTTSFNYGLTAAYGTTVNSIHSPINSSSAELDSQFVTGLTANTAYHYFATDGTDNGSDVIFITAPNPPVVGTPNTPTANGFTATWTAPAAMGAAPFTYTIEVSSDPAFATGVTTQAGISSGATSFAFTTLNSETQYYYRVKAVNATASSGWSATSAPVSTLIVATTSGCVSGTGASTDPGAIAKTLSPPVIDGTVDAVWGTVPSNIISNVSVGSGSNTNSSWKAMWTTDTLYFLIQVTDPVLIAQNSGLTGSNAAAFTRSTSGNYYDSDGVEITLDPDYSHGTSYDGKNDVQFRFNLGTSSPSGQSCGCATQFTGSLFNTVDPLIDYKISTTGTGYNVEVAIPWGHDAANPGINLITPPSTYGTASINQPIGVEVQINDATNTGGRAAQYSWFNSSSAPYQDPSQFAKAALYACAITPVVVLPTVTNITSTGATLGATVTSSGDSPLTARGTGYTASPDNSATGSAAAEGGTGITIYSGPTRTDMASQTKYYYLGYATNTNGGTGVSEVKSFYTLSALPTAQPVLTADACTQMTLNWTAITFPPAAEATQTGYLLLRADAPAVPTTTGITTRVETTQSALSAGTTLIATISSGSTLTYTDATAAAGTTYNYILVPFTWDGVTADSTYNYFTVSPSGVSASIGNLAAPVASATQQPSCAVSTGTITINPWDNTLTYSIDGTNFVAGPTFSNLTSNTYNVVAKSGTCTSNSTPVTIDPAPATPTAPTATPVPPTCTIPTGSISITAVTGLTYSIDGTNYFAFSDPAFTNLAPAVYQLTAKNSSNCASVPTPITIAVLPPCGDFFIPNLITPNSDGKNDLFEITALPAGSALKVFNRWGEGVYQSNNYNNQWTAINIADGVYYYDLLLPDGKQYKGWFDIIR